ncbi:hypothetical protein DH2020_023262 [Rehmannia glutinosa]|uniref:Reverse transcriptase domain-containing protein n=1 Tax=Rehmannia glutinosa TaxID=99300 RepID=A0ABR0W7B8_REHGL
MLELGDLIDSPWLLLGDFNTIKNPDEKLNGKPFTSKPVEEFHDTCAYLGLSEVQSMGCYFTWTNNTIWCRLDRALINSAWSNSNWRCSADIHVPGNVSDHSPIVVSFFEQKGKAQFILCKKLKALKPSLKELNTFHFSQISSRVKQVKTALKNSQIQLHTDPLNSALCDSVKELKAKETFLAKAERSFLFQKAKCDYLNNSDRNTKFFHSIVKRNPLRKHMNSVILENGSKTSSFDDLSKAFVNYFKNLFGTSFQTCPVDLQTLQTGPCIDEDDSSLLSSPVTTQAIKMALFDIEDERLESVVPKLIDPAQSAFISAYDTISWSFLEQVLNGLGFPPIFISWVMECVSSVSYSICINGSLQGKFPGKRGLRQGDPMSPALFLLCMEYLSRLLKVRTNTLSFKYHPRCDALKITHLAFVDDLMFFSRGDLPSVKILIDCLNDFKNASGLDINSFKSNLFTAGIIGDKLDNILNLLNFPLGTLPVKYLGVPLAAQKLNVNHYAPLYDRIASYINKWTANSLSYAGRLLLIKSVLQGVECFWLQIFPLPNTVIDRINRLCRVFLWGKNTSPIKWSKVCLSSDEGGLGLRDVHSWNRALLAKVLWNIHSKADSLWVR